MRGPIAANEHDQTAFERLRQFLLTDLDRIIGQEVGGNYAATTLIAVGCEILGKLKYGGKGTEAGRRFFGELVRERVPTAVADTIFDAIRNGLAHWYDTQEIRVDGQRLSVGISWRERPHLCVDRKTAILYVNVRDLFKDFTEAVERYARLLLEDVAARRKFLKAWQKSRVRATHVQERAAWLELLRGVKGDEEAKR